MYLADLLNINPAPNNGTPGLLHEMLKSPPAMPTLPTPRGRYNACLYPNKTDAEKWKNITQCYCPDIEVLTNLSLYKIPGKDII